MSLRAAVDRRVLRTPVPTRYGQQRTATGPSKKAPSVYRPRKHRVRAISALEQLSCQTTAMIHLTTPSPPPLPLSRTVCFLPRLLHDDRRWSSPKSPPLARPRGRPGHPSPQKLSHPEAAANAGDLVHRRHHRALGCCSARWPSHGRCTAYTAYPPPSNLCSWPGLSQITGRLLSLSLSLAVSWVPLLPDGAARWHSQIPANNTACGGEERRMGVLHRTFAQPETRTNVSSPSRNLPPRVKIVPGPSNPGRYRPPSWRHGTAAVIPTTPGRYLSQLPSEAQLLPPYPVGPRPDVAPA